MTKTSFGDQLHQMWQTRPVRLPRQGPIAGVAAGFGQRYNVDPVLVRVALVVSTVFGGAGVVLYLLGWVLLNEAGDQSSPAESLFGKGHSSQSPTKTIVLLVALAIAISTVGPIGVGLAGSGLISMALLVAGWWMLHMRNPQPPPGTSSFGFDTDTGLGATGYPGTVFPQTSPYRTGDFYTPDVPPTSMYTPYTKLPDAYVPENPVRQEVSIPNDQAADLLNKGNADTGLLHKGTEQPGNTTEQIHPTTGAEVLRTDSGALDTDADSGAGAHAESSSRASAGTQPGTSTATKPSGADNSSTAMNSASADGSDTSSGASTMPSLGAASTGTGSGAGSASPSAATPPSLEKSATPTASNTDEPSTAGPGSNESASGTTNHGQTPRRPQRTSAPTFPAPGVTPPSWDPLGVAPLAWDLPEPTPVRTIAQPAPKRPRSRLTPMVLGLAIIAAAGAGGLAASGVEWMTPGRIGAVALAVIGIGLVIGAFMRRGYGLLVLTAPLAGFVLLASLIGPIQFDSATMGDRTWAPASVADLAPKYELTAGTGTLDLTGLTLTENRAVEISIQMGEAHILLPENMTVRTECAVNMGEVNCPTGITGPNPPGGPVLDLKVNIRAGQAEVRRG